MVAQLVLMLAFLNTSSPVNPYWTNSERLNYQFSAVTLCGEQATIDNGDSYVGDYDYYVESDVTLQFDLLSNSTDSWVLQLNGFYSTHYLYIEDSGYRVYVDDVTCNSPSFELNYTSSNMQDLEDIHVLISVNSGADPYVFFYKDYGTIQYQSVISFQLDTFNASSVFYSDFHFDTRMLIPQINEHLAKVYNSNYQRGYNDGYVYGLDVGEGRGYNAGYSQGYQDGSSQDEIATSIFIGILDVALLPINMFLRMLNFEVFGINIGGFVSALLTIAIVVIIMRIVVSGGNKSDS